MTFQLFADSKRQSKMDAAYAAGFDPDADTDAQDDNADFDPIRDIEVDTDPEMDALIAKHGRGMWKASW